LTLPSVGSREGEKMIELSFGAFLLIIVLSLLIGMLVLSWLAARIVNNR
jgi:hypothetical protein